MELRDIEAFIAIGRLGSVTAAAEHLHLTQPAVSQRIKRIEEELGFSVFERLGSKMILTYPGEFFLRKCISLTTELSESIQEVKQMTSPPYTYSIGISDILAETSFVDKIRDFCQAHPSLNIRLFTIHNDEVSHLIASGEIDVGFRYYKEQNIKSIEQIKVGDEKIIVIAAKNTEIIPVNPSIQHFSGVKWITYPKSISSGTIFSSILHSFLLLNHVQEYSTNEIDSLTVQKALVESDLGLGFVPEASIQQEIKFGTLQAIDIPSFENVIPIMALYRFTSLNIPLTEELVNIISMKNEDVHFERAYIRDE